ncbi:hypothetical protein F5890DRAFT_1517805 [Lentinula detonsa]|uniref:Uncharacterized protein n=1 Tax=Lentinula detonsa TaxID=2804962 RepID=A0AA38UU24_9AGAR|nr:hypothetical protein F5890DRAFT_1517805 [Lentinula detonsa]
MFQAKCHNKHFRRQLTRRRAPCSYLNHIHPASSSCRSFEQTKSGKKKQGWCRRGCCNLTVSGLLQFRDNIECYHHGYFKGHSGHRYQRRLRENEHEHACPECIHQRYIYHYFYASASFKIKRSAEKLVIRVAIYGPVYAFFLTSRASYIYPSEQQIKPSSATIFLLRGYWSKLDQLQEATRSKIVDFRWSTIVA